MDFKFNFCEDDIGNNVEKTDKFAETHTNSSIKDESNIEHACTSYSLLDILDHWNSCNNIYTIESISTKNNHQICFVQVMHNSCQLTYSALKNNEPERSSVEIEDTKTSTDILEVSDLVPGIYGGGLKVWECSIDLVDFLYQSKTDFSGKTVLELGCGIGLPGIAASNIGALKVIFQDFNDFVIANTTGPSVCLNEWLNIKDLVDGNQENDNITAVNQMEEAVKRLRTHSSATTNKYSLLSGDWSRMTDFIKTEVDIILTSETIYEPSDYLKLHNVLKSVLAEDGIIFLAAKSFYFGVGGGTHLWQEFVKTQGYFQIELACTINAPLKREILKMTKLINCTPFMT